MYTYLWRRVCRVIFKLSTLRQTPLPPRPEILDSPAGAEWLAQSFVQSSAGFTTALNPEIDALYRLPLPFMRGEPQAVVALNGHTFACVKIGAHWAFASDADGEEVVLHPQVPLSTTSHMSAKLLAWHRQTPFEEGYSKVLLTSSSRHERMEWLAQNIPVYLVEEDKGTEIFEHHDVRIYRQGRHLVAYQIKDQKILVAIRR